MDLIKESNILFVHCEYEWFEVLLLKTRWLENNATTLLAAGKEKREFDN